MRSLTLILLVFPVYIKEKILTLAFLFPEPKISNVYSSISTKQSPILQSIYQIKIDQGF